MENQLQLPELLTIANFAKLQTPQVTVQAVYQWIKLGKITPVIIDGIKFIPKYTSVTAGQKITQVGTE